MREITQGSSSERPLSDVVVVVNKAGKDSLGIYTKGDSIGIWMTDTQGQAVIKHTEKQIVFNVYKIDYSDKYDGYLLAGIDSEGSFVYKDLNGDGMHTVEDKFDFELPYYVGYEGGTQKSSMTVYMTKEYVNPETPVLPDADSLRVVWKKAMAYYMQRNVEAESRLMGGDSGFNYSQVRELSDEVWNHAYDDVLDKGRAYVHAISEGTDSKYIELKQNILMDMSLVYSQLYGYYGQLVDKGQAMPVEQLIGQMEELMTEVNENQRFALSAMLAKVYLIREDWQKAWQACRDVIASGTYRLEPQLDHSMVPSVDSKEVIYGDFRIDGGYVHPLLYREVLIMAAYANIRIGTPDMALNYVNELLVSYGYASVDMASMEEALKSMLRQLDGTGQYYPYAKLFSLQLGVRGFESPKNWLLPIPEFIVQYPGMVQNPGY